MGALDVGRDIGLCDQISGLLYGCAVFDTIQCHQEHIDFEACSLEALATSASESPSRLLSKSRTQGHDMRRVSQMHDREQLSHSRIHQYIR